MLSRLLTEGIAEAPADAGPLQAVATGLARASNEMGPRNRELGPRLKAAVATSAELQERDALKSVGLAAAIATALLARGVPDPTAHLAGELGSSRSNGATRSGLKPAATPTTGSRSTPSQPWTSCGPRPPRSANDAARLPAEARNSSATRQPPTHPSCTTRLSTSSGSVLNALVQG